MQFELSLGRWVGLVGGFGRQQNQGEGLHFQQEFPGRDWSPMDSRTKKQKSPWSIVCSKIINIFITKELLFLNFFPGNQYFERFWLVKYSAAIK